MGGNIVNTGELRPRALRGRDWEEEYRRRVFGVQKEREEERVFRQSVEFVCFIHTLSSAAADLKWTMNLHHDPNPFDEEEDEIVNPFSVNFLQLSSLSISGWASLRIHDRRTGYVDSSFICSFARVLKGSDLRSRNCIDFSECMFVVCVVLLQKGAGGAGRPVASRPFNVDATVDIPLDTVNVRALYALAYSHFQLYGI